MENPTLNDFIHAGAARMFEDNSMINKQDYLYYENALRGWVKYLIEQDAELISSMGWILHRDKNASRVEWSLDRKVMAYVDYDVDNYSNYLYITPPN